MTKLFLVSDLYVACDKLFYLVKESIQFFWLCCTENTYFLLRIIFTLYIFKFYIIVHCYIA